MTSGEPKPGSGILAAACAAFGLFVLFRLALLWTSGGADLAARVPDDAFYYLQIARNIAAGGGSTFDGVNLTNGYHPLWMFVCAAVALLTGAEPGDGPDLLFIRAALTIQLLAGVAGVAFATISVKRQCQSSGAASLMPALACLPWAIYAMTDGLESGLVLLWSGAAIWLLLEWKPLATDPSPRDIAFGTLLGMGFLARLDLAFFCVALGLVTLALRGREMKWVAVKAACWAIPAIATAAVYLLLNSQHFDSLTPISGKLKLSFPHADFQSSYLLRFPQAVLAVVLLAGAAACAKRLALPEHTRQLLLVAAVFVALHFGFMLLFLDWAVHQWHFSSYLLFAFAGAALAADALPVNRTRPNLLIGAVVAAIALGAAGQFAFLHRRADHAFQVRSWEAAAWARDGGITPGALIGMSDCGAFGYARGGLVLNLDGVVNNRAYQESLAQDGLERYLERQGVRFIAHHAVRANQVRPGYGRYEYSATGRLLDVKSSILLMEREEVYRSQPYDDGRGEKVFVIWAIESRME